MHYFKSRGPATPGDPKHNNNYGYVARHSRNTPQAFSHFSYEYTDGKMMVVDIQTGCTFVSAGRCAVATPKEHQKKGLT